MPHPPADMPETADASVASPAGRLVPVVGLWGGGVALVAIAVAWNRGLSADASIAVITVAGAAMAGLGLLGSLSPRPAARWAFPVLGAQMVRTMLAPALGLAVYLLADVDAVAFWLTLLAVAAAMLAGETIAVAKMFGSGGHPAPGREAVA
jgi:hypothetical protein